MTVEVTRAKPLLGTVAEVRAEAADEAAAHRAIEAAFATIARIHAAMSFQSPDSDLAAVGRAEPDEIVALRPETHACVAWALALAEETGGVFDPVLPGAAWTDLKLETEGVRPLRRLRLDLSGVAKGYAVDRACAELRRAGASAGALNAGGDLRAFGPRETVVNLTPRSPAPPAAVLLQDAALASSDTLDAQARHGAPQHRDGRTGVAAPAGFAAVTAPHAITADALTKIALVLGEAARDLFASRGATAHLFRPDTGWISFGAAA